MYSSRLRATHMLPYGRVSLTETPPGQRTLLDRDPSWKETPLWTETPPGQRPPLDREPSWTGTPYGQRRLLDRDPQRQRPPDRDTHGQRLPPGQRFLPSGQRTPPPPRIESQTGVKSLPSRNFVARGN